LGTGSSGYLEAFRNPFIIALAAIDVTYFEPIGIELKNTSSVQENWYN
jgi:hypothetical protein